MEISTHAKPCPFCGCDEIMHTWGWPENPYSALECTDCGAYMQVYDGDHYSVVLEKWNSRVKEEDA